jgi:hypothetical protein
MTSRISLADLAAADIHLRPAEAVTIVSDICRQYLEGRLRGIPSTGVLRLTRDGDVVAEGPMPADRDAVFRAARLLDELVSDFDAAPEYRPSGGLRLVIARGLGTLDLPPFASLEEFRAALARFASLDVRETTRDLFMDAARERLPREPLAVGPVTISDVRRARRATGLTLHAVAQIAGVPAARLRDLEWGDVRRWPADEQGRALVVRYARAAGLDEELVLSVAWPLIQELSETECFETAPISELVASGPQQVEPVVPPVATGAAARRPSRWSPVAALLLGVAVVARPTDGPPKMLAEPTDAMRVAPAQPQAVPAASAVVRPRARAPKAVRPRPGHGATVVMQQTVKARDAAPVRDRDVTVGPRKAPARLTAAPARTPEDVSAPPLRAAYQDVPEPPIRTPFLEKPLLRIVIR